MSKFVRSVALAAAIAGLVSAAGTSTTAAQDKKKDAKVVTKEDMAGTILLTKDAKDLYRFKVVGADGKAIVNTPKGYAKKEDALKAIETLKAIVAKGKVVEAQDDDDEKEMKKDAKKGDKKKEPEKK